MRQARAERTDDQQPAEDEHRGLEIGHGPRSVRCTPDARSLSPAVLARSPAAGRRRRRWTATPRRTCASSAAASPACGRRCTPRRERPGARRRPARGRDRRLRRQRAQRRLRVASLTHGHRERRWRASPSEIDALERLGRGELRGHARPTSSAHGIDCDFEETGELRVAARAARGRRGSTRRPSCCGASATTPTCSTARRCGAEVASPTYLGGVWDRTGAALLDPGKLAAGPARRGAAARRARSTSTRRSRRARRRGAASRC